MNQLALAIRKIDEGKKDLESCQLNSSELIALKLISNMIGMSPADLATHLQLKDDPLEWLIPPLYSAQ
jgi:hypothetical protein